jgi:hypothetical protein
MGPSGSGALIAALGSRVPSLFRHGHEQLVQTARRRAPWTLSPTYGLGGLSVAWRSWEALGSEVASAATARTTATSG